MDHKTGFEHGYPELLVKALARGFLEDERCEWSVGIPYLKQTRTGLLVPCFGLVLFPDNVYHPVTSSRS